MNKVFTVIFLMVLFSCSTAPNYHSFDQALENAINRVENDLPEGSDIAILDFKSDNPNLSSYIIEELYDKLVNNRKLSIMERSRIDTIAIEVGYQLSGEVDDKEIISIGHQLGADYVVTGQITFSGEAYRLRVFAIDIEKGRRVASSSLNINPNDIQIKYLLAKKVNTSADERLIGSWRRNNDYYKNYYDVLKIFSDGTFRYDYFYESNNSDQAYRDTVTGTWSATSQYIHFKCTVKQEFNFNNTGWQESNFYEEDENFYYQVNDNTLGFNIDNIVEGFVLQIVSGSFERLSNNRIN